ncbi:MAG: hypothetical protein VX469_01670, partial [Pseudomonadota bacterium]|nr:hypothetical protein [Pseudomonadota bacterium]
HIETIIIFVITIYLIEINLYTALKINLTYLKRLMTASILPTLLMSGFNYHNLVFRLVMVSLGR